MLACAGLVFTGTELASPYFLPAAAPRLWVGLAFVLFALASAGASRSVAIREEKPLLAWYYLACLLPFLLAATVTLSCTIVFWR